MSELNGQHNYKCVKYLLNKQYGKVVCQENTILQYFAAGNKLLTSGTAK